MSKFRAITKRTHYEILGVNEDCTSAELKSAFLLLSKKYHPDTNSGDSGLHDKFIKINEAYSVLRVIDTRKSYDYGLLQLRQFRTVRDFNSMNYGNFRERYQDNQEPFRYYDPTIDPRRHHRRYQNYNEGMYYGFNGVPRKPNLVIVGGCIFFLFVGAFLQFAALAKISKFNQDRWNERSMIITKSYNQTRKKAEENGVNKQLDQFERQLGKEVD